MAAFEEIFEIERKLRTGRPDVQQNAITLVPECMKRASPLEVSTLFLRLVDYFCASGNEQRMSMMVIVQRCKEHGGKARPHAEEITKRLCIVWESNDVLARSLVIRFLGSLAGSTAFIPEAVYRVHQSLKSLHECEQEAAVLAAFNFSLECPLTILVDPLLSLLNRLHPYSFLRPKIYYTLGRLSGNLSLELQTFNVISQLLETKTEMNFRKDAIDCLFQIVGNIEILVEPFCKLITTIYPESDPEHVEYMNFLQRINEIYS